MGKGSNTTSTTQQQTYNPAGAGQIQGALTQAQQAAQLPFNIPQAPVAGFSQDQQTAFGNINSAQGMAQPYINQAQQYFSPQGAQQFLNPYAANVMAGMKDVFGQQASQNTGQLTQAAGGVGADRIAVGQSELAPGLGGTTSGMGSTTGPAPSMLSQILGLGTAGVGAAGGAGAFGGKGSYGGGSPFTGDAYGGSSANPLPGLSASDYGAGYAE